MMAVHSEKFIRLVRGVWVDSDRHLLVHKAVYQSGTHSEQSELTQAKYGQAGSTLKSSPVRQTVC